MFIRVSKQKVYNSLLIIKAQYHSFHHLCIYISYTPYLGLRLNVKPDLYIKRTCWMKDTLEVSDCLNKGSLFEIAEDISIQTELWIKKNKFEYDNRDEIYIGY